MAHVSRGHQWALLLLSVALSATPLHAGDGPASASVWQSSAASSSHTVSRSLKFVLYGAATLFAVDQIDLASKRYFFPYHQTPVSRSLRKVGNYAQISGPAIGTAFALEGLAAHNSKSLETAALAWESFIVAGGLEQILKYSTGRRGPAVEDEPYSFSPGKLRSPFPSGHMTVVVAAATVFTEQYPRWYVIGPTWALTGGILYSRLTTNQHWVSDLAVASMLGFGVSHSLRIYHERRRSLQLSVLPGWVEARLAFGGADDQPTKS